MTTRNNTPEEPVPADAVIGADVRFGPDGTGSRSRAFPWERSA